MNAVNDPGAELTPAGLRNLRRLAGLCKIAGRDEATAAAMMLLGREDPAVTALGRAVLQCDDRDSRAMRAPGLEPRPPCPQGRALEPGDWPLPGAACGRPGPWRDVDDTGK